MGEPLRVGLIGCGNVVGYGHRPALSALKAAGEVQTGRAGGHHARPS